MNRTQTGSYDGRISYGKQSSDTIELSWPEHQWWQLALLPLLPDDAFFRLPPEADEAGISQITSNPIRADIAQPIWGA